MGRNFISKIVKRNIHGKTISSDEFGNQFLLDLDNFIDSEIYLKGSFEKQIIAIFSELVKKNKCYFFIDVGANIGFHSIYFASQPNIEKVYAFEPDPRNFSQLLANIFLNEQCEKVTPYNLALSSKNGEEAIYLSRMKKNYETDKLNTGTSSMIFNEERHSMDGAITIQTRRLDGLLKLENQSIAIKIDVEGYESVVLDGMNNIIRNNQCVILLEIFKDHFETVNGYLRKMAYYPLSSIQLPESNYIYLKDSDC
jgi:FkbM family methyltransferase